MSKPIPRKERGIIPALVLFLICMLSTAALALTFELTKDRIAFLQKESLIASKQRLFAEGQRFDSLTLPEAFDPSEVTIFEAVYDQNDQALGYIIQALVKGYGSDPIPVLTAIDSDGQILGIEIGDNAETAGLGKRIEEADFRQQFGGYSNLTFFATSSPASLEPGIEGQVIDSISGATISSEAVCHGVNLACQVQRSLVD